jgi:hypothetical protein
VCTAQRILFTTLALSLFAAGCANSAPAVSSSASQGPATYKVMITEPSGNIGDGNGLLFAHWSCDPTVDPATRYRGAQDALWTNVDGVTGQGLLRAEASCASGALLTVQVDASAVSTDYRPTRLRCEVFSAGGERVADETVIRGLGTSDPVCRVNVP